MEEHINIHLAFTTDVFIALAMTVTVYFPSLPWLCTLGLAANLTNHRAPLLRDYHYSKNSLN